MTCASGLALALPATAKAAGAAIEVAGPDELVAEVGRLLADAGRRAALGAAALAFHAAHRGALDRLWSWLEPQISAALAHRRQRSPLLALPQQLRRQLQQPRVRHPRHLARQTGRQRGVHLPQLQLQPRQLQRPRS